MPRVADEPRAKAQEPAKVSAQAQSIQRAVEAFQQRIEQRFEAAMGELRAGGVLDATAVDRMQGSAQRAFDAMREAVEASGQSDLSDDVASGVRDVLRRDADAQALAKQVDESLEAARRAADAPIDPSASDEDLARQSAACEAAEQDLRSLRAVRELLDATTAAREAVRDAEAAAGRGDAQARAVQENKILDQSFAKHPAIRELWEDAVAASRNPPDLSTVEGARRAYEQAMGRFVRRLTSEEDPRAAQAREIFVRSGFRFQAAEDGRLKQQLPVLDLPDVAKAIDASKHMDLLRVSGQHVGMIQDPAQRHRALDAENLRFMIARDNIQMDSRAALAREIRNETTEEWQREAEPEPE